MSTASSPIAAPRRVLASELKQLRQAAGLTHADVANRLGWQQGKVSKIESAKQRVGVEAVIALAEICRATSEHRDRLVELARTARTKGWWESYRDVLPPAGLLYVGLESDAEQMQFFGVETVPDLLQCREYATALLRARCTADGGVERRLEVLLKRQRHSVERRGTEIDCILAESALLRAVGGESVLATQLRHLRWLAGHSAARIRVLPFSAGAHSADASFAVFRYRSIPHPDIAFVSGPLGHRPVEDDWEVRSCAETMEQLGSLALDEKESLSLLERRQREVAV